MSDAPNVGGPKGRQPDRQRMAEHAARQKGSGIMISPSSIAIGIIFLVLFALACALQVGQLSSGKHPKGDEDHEHGETEVQPTHPEDWSLTKEERARKSMERRKESTAEFRAARTSEADAGASTYSVALVEQWSTMPSRQLSPEQSRAVRALQVFKDLRSDDVNKRLNAGFELYGMTRHWYLLVLALDDPKPEVRRIAANLLAYAAWPRSAPKLEAVAWSDPDPDVREAAVLALGSGPAMPESVPLLTSFLSDVDPHISQAAAVALADMGSLGVAEAVPGLLVAAKHSDAEARGQAITGLEALIDGQTKMEGDASAVPSVATEDVQAALTAALSDTSSARAREYAVRGLALLDRTDLAPQFLSLAENDKQWEVRFHAARTMGKWFPRQAQGQHPIVEALRHISVEDPDQAVQFAAIASLKEMGFDPGKWSSGGTES